MIFYYNREGIGDILITYLKEGGLRKFERRGDVSEIFEAETGEVLGYNFFNASTYLPLDHKEGLIKANQDFISRLNEKLLSYGFSERIINNDRPFIVTGYVLKSEKHPDSDHMHVCKVDVGPEQLQIVCGAPNIEEGQKVVVAKVGALMPDGMVIRPSVLRGIASDGMICSARELGLPGAPQKRGILTLDPVTAVGQDFYQLLPR
ncbi:YtpR family tRNA-binding protein [Sporolactobacillus sp. KGMB 08714]|uniref:YtpR family tRNA-binding protein n=1 Tax=Sporolactobacillus sp. KGMB 08714 TaxID=3064704 RepID=UPI002FBECCED